MRVTAIIAAGGAGTRLGADRPKQLLELHGRSILEHSVDAFDRHPAIAETIVVLPSELAASPPAWLAARRQYAWPWAVCAGRIRWPTRFDMVDAATDVVLVHDAARPFVTPEVIDRAIDAAAAHGAAIAAIPVSDTVKRGEKRNGHPVITETIPREPLYLAQTPQGFGRGVLRDAVALGRSGVEATDESMLAEQAGTQCPARRWVGLEREDHDGRGSRRRRRGAWRIAKRDASASATTCTVWSPAGD